MNTKLCYTLFGKEVNKVIFPYFLISFITLIQEKFKEIYNTLINITFVAIFIPDFTSPPFTQC